MRDCFFIQMIRFSKGKSTSPAIIILGFLSILNNSTFNFPVNASAESTSARALASNSAKFVLPETAVNRAKMLHESDNGIAS